MKLIIEIDKDYYDIVKYHVELGDDYKPYVIIANGIPYEETPKDEPIQRIFNGCRRGECKDCNDRYICKFSCENVKNNDNQSNSCHTCFFNDKGFCRMKYFTIYDDSYGCDLYSKMKNDNI